MIEVRLSLEQWQQVLAILSTAPWAQANPLIMELGNQLRAGAEMAAKRDAAVTRGNGLDEEAARGGRSA
jgi:hypothetical protein